MPSLGFMDWNLYEQWIIPICLSKFKLDFISNPFVIWNLKQFSNPIIQFFKDQRIAPYPFSTFPHPISKPAFHQNQLIPTRPIQTFPTMNNMSVESHQQSHQSKIPPIPTPAVPPTLSPIKSIKPNKKKHKPPPTGPLLPLNHPWLAEL